MNCRWLILFICSAASSFAQPEKLTINEFCSKFDVSPLWTSTENRYVFGFIGDNYRRIRIKILSAKKDSIEHGTYHIVGKSEVGRNICDFSGAIKVTSIEVFDRKHFGVDESYKDREILDEGRIKGKYFLSEDRLQSHTGIFQGTFTTDWYVDSAGLLRYDDIEQEADGFCNNQFIGIWKEYNSKVSKICNWGDYRIPGSRKLDQGAGEFSPRDEYLKFGWESYRNAEFGNDSTAMREESREWWNLSEKMMKSNQHNDQEIPFDSWRSAQTSCRTVGIVTDSRSGAPIGSCFVRTFWRLSGAITDSSGRFEIKTPCDYVRLTFLRQGYWELDTQIVVSGSSPFVFHLEKQDSTQPRWIAMQKCKERLRERDIDISSLEFNVTPGHPITLDTIKNGSVHLFYMVSYQELVDSAGTELLGKSFWNCQCVPERLIPDAAHELFIDAKTNEVLFEIPPARR